SVQSHVLLEGPSGSTFVRSVASCQQDLRHLGRMFELSFQQDASFRQYFWYPERISGSNTSDMVLGEQ
ncbi:hypothetical protein J6590_105678, partial [Homalodisca vitripennis]